jgi:hypothetical protein
MLTEILHEHRNCTLNRMLLFLILPLLHLVLIPSLSVSFVKLRTHTLKLDCTAGSEAFNMQFLRNMFAWRYSKYIYV